MTVTLKPPSSRHAEAFIRAVHRSRPLHKGLVAPPSDPESYRRFVRSLRQHNKCAFLVLSESEEIAGVVNVGDIVRGPFQSAFLGYYAFLPLAGQGLMRKGLQGVLRHCFRNLKLHRLEANIQPSNERSISLVRGLGFRKEGFSPRYLKVCGRWRDHERWAILAEDWRIGVPRERAALEREADAE